LLYCATHDRLPYINGKGVQLDFLQGTDNFSLLYSSLNGMSFNWTQ
jgi:hypothetical protein